MWGQCWAGARSVIRTSAPAPGYSPPGRRWAEAGVRPGPVNTQTRAHARRDSPATGNVQQLYLQHFDILQDIIFYPFAITLLKLMGP